MTTNDRKSEPQSYGSQAEWVQGKTPQTVNPGQGPSASPQSEFYDSRRDSEENGPEQGGLVSPVQAGEMDAPAPAPGLVTEDDPTVRKVNGEDGGAKRGSYFKDRDYRP